MTDGLHRRLANEFHWRSRWLCGRPHGWRREGFDSWLQRWLTSGSLAWTWCWARFRVKFVAHFDSNGLHRLQVESSIPNHKLCKLKIRRLTTHAVNAHSTRARKHGSLAGGYNISIDYQISIRFHATRVAGDQPVSKSSGDAVSIIFNPTILKKSSTTICPVTVQGVTYSRASACQYTILVFSRVPTNI